MTCPRIYLIYYLHSLKIFSFLVFPSPDYIVLIPNFHRIAPMMVWNLSEAIVTKRYDKMFGI